MTAAGGQGRITLEVLADRIDTLSGQFSSLAGKIDALNYVNPETLALQMQLVAAHQESIQKDIADVRADIARSRENVTWLWRTVAGILLSALLVGLLAAAGLPR